MDPDALALLSIVLFALLLTLLLIIWIRGAL